MYVNEQIRKTLASKILIVKDKLKNLENARVNLHNQAQDNVKRFSIDVTPTKNFVIIKN